MPAPLTWKHKSHVTLTTHGVDGRGLCHRVTVGIVRGGETTGDVTAAWAAWSLASDKIWTVD